MKKLNPISHTLPYSVILRNWIAFVFGVGFFIMIGIWKDIEDYEGLYQINKFGNVKSLSRKQSVKERILKQNNNTSGYLIVNLYKNKKSKTTMVHHLVWDYFGDEPRNGRVLQVDHKNNIRIDCWIGNLQLLNQR